MVRRRLPSPAMIVAIVALVVGLTGSAVALQGKNSVKSNDIAPGNVKASDLHDLAVHPNALDLFQTHGVPGPLVDHVGDRRYRSAARRSASTFRRPGSSFSTRASPDSSAAAARTRSAQVHLFEPNLLPNGPSIMTFTSPEPTVALHGAGRWRQRRRLEPDARRVPRVLAGHPGHVHVRAALQQPGRRHRHVPERRPLGRSYAVTTALDRCRGQLGIERIALHQGARPLAQRLALGLEVVARARSRSPARSRACRPRPSPRVVSAGVPIRSPDGFIGGRSSNGIALRLTVIPTCSSRSSPVLAVEPGRVEVDEHEVHVGAAGEDVDAVCDQLLGERAARWRSSGAGGRGTARSRRSAAPPPWRR